jgi:hypothetical protein
MGETAAVGEGLGALGAGAGALGSMTGGAELAGLTSAAVPEVFNPATVGGLAESMAASNAGLAGLNAGAGAIAPQFSMSAPELFNPATEASATDPLQLPQEGAKETLEGAGTSEKLASMDTAINAGKGITGESTIDDLINMAKNPNWSNIKAFASNNPKTALAMGLAGLNMMKPNTPKVKAAPQYIRPYTNTRTANAATSFYSPYSGGSTAERNYFTGGLQAGTPFRAASGGLTALAVGGPIETMSAMNAVGENLGYPQSQYQTDIYSNPNVQRPQAMNLIGSESDTNVDRYTGEEKFASGGDTGGYQYTYDPVTQQFTQLNDPVAVAAQQTLPSTWNSIGTRFQPQKVEAKPFTPVVTGGVTTPAIQQATQAPVQQAAQAPINIPAYQTPEQQLGLDNFYKYMNQQLSGMRSYQGYAAGGGIFHLGDYSDGGRLLRGPGDGVSDSIPASIGGSRPARLADGEFVRPARIVSEIGNGSTEAGARKLYAMMDRVQKARKKSVGKERVAVDSKADKYLPA